MFLDWEGDVFISLTKPMNYCSNAAMAKAMGLFEVVKLCKELGLLNCMFEGDSSHVVTAILQYNGEVDSYNPLIANIKS